MIKIINTFTISLLLAMLSAGAQAQRVIIDQLNRQVTLPDKVQRVVVLQHQTLNLLVELNATDKIVGIQYDWEQQLGHHYARLVPQLIGKAKVGDLTHVNLESLAALHPQVVFVTHYAPQEMIDQISQLGIAVVAISLRHDVPGQERELNPKMANEEQAYDQGLKEGIRLIGDIVDRSPQATMLIEKAFRQRQLVSERLQHLPEAQRVRAYMANPELTTYGSGKYTGLMMKHAGALNVAAATVKGYKQVSMEQVITWNPQVIFVQDRYPQVVEQIQTQPEWQPIDAVKQHRVYLMPDYTKAWGYPMPEAIGLGELWMAKKLYPEMFSDIDTRRLAEEWYQTFYRTHYTGAE